MLGAKGLGEVLPKQQMTSGAIRPLLFNLKYCSSNPDHAACCSSRSTIQCSGLELAPGVRPKSVEVEYILTGFREPHHGVHARAAMLLRQPLARGGSENHIMVFMQEPQCYSASHWHVPSIDEGQAANAACRVERLGTERHLAIELFCCIFNTWFR